MRYLSVCSGIEAATVAWEPLGWEPVAFSEIEPFPCAVLDHHYPHVPNLGDMTKIDGAEWRGKVDVLVGGTPCQAFSVAGKRASLSDARGNLTLKFVELADAIQPPVIVWENVPGVLSTKDNAFGCFLAGLVGADRPLVPLANRSWPGFGMVAGPKRRVAWRVIDAQYFGVAQRRRRVYLVGVDSGMDIDPGAILFERESVCRNSPPSRRARSKASKDACKGSNQNGVTDKIGSHWEGGPHPTLSQALRASDGAHNGGGLNGQDAYTGRLMACVQYPEFTAYEHHPQDSRIKELDPNGPFPQLNAKAGTGGGNLPLVAFNCLQDPVPSCDGLAPCLGSGSTHGQGTHDVLAGDLRVRRLLPVECERLQGFKDNYTLIPSAKARRIEEDLLKYLLLFFPEMSLEEARRTAADGPRFKALGNSMAVPCVRWVGERIQLVCSSHKEVGLLAAGGMR